MDSNRRNRLGLAGTGTRCHSAEDELLLVLSRYEQSVQPGRQELVQQTADVWALRDAHGQQVVPVEDRGNVSQLIEIQPKPFGQRRVRRGKYGRPDRNSGPARAGAGGYAGPGAWETPALRRTP